MDARPIYSDVRSADIGTMTRPQRSHIGRLLRRVVATLCVGALPLAVFAPAANAGLLVKSATNCPQQALERPFLRWLDPASYVLTPQGTLESTTGWTLSRASRVAGNEPFFVHGAGEKYSLSLPAGSSATTPTQCVGLGHPTLRLFARNTGSVLSLLKVEVLVEDNLGLVKSLPIGALPGTSSWAPTLPMPVIANLLPLLPGNLTPVRFRFTPVGLGGAWQIDDVYVDPFRAG
jgi:hypothetical protein